MRPSYLYDGNIYTGKTPSLYWDGGPCRFTDIFLSSFNTARRPNWFVSPGQPRIPFSTVNYQCTSSSPITWPWIYPTLTCTNKTPSSQMFTRSVPSKGSSQTLTQSSFKGNIFKCIFVSENVRILIRILLYFVPDGSDDKKVSIRSGNGLDLTRDKPLHEPILTQLSGVYLCVTRR